MFRQRHPLPVATDVGHCISEDDRVRRAMIDPTPRVSADNNCRVIVDDDGPVCQSLRCRRINIAADDFPRIFRAARSRFIVSPALRVLTKSGGNIRMGDKGSQTITTDLRLLIAQHQGIIMGGSPAHLLDPSKHSSRCFAAKLRAASIIPQAHSGVASPCK